MEQKKVAKAAVKPAAKPVAAAKVEAPKAAVKPVAEVKVEAPKAETVKPAAKAPAKTAAKPAAKKAPAKKAAAPKAAAPKAAKTTAKAAAKETVALNIQFAGKSYTTEDLVASAKDVWKYDLNKKAADFKKVELYVKPEESQVYYVINDEFSGSFFI